MTRCGALTRGGLGATCQLAEGHSGSHSAVTYYCDGCGQTFRGTRGFACGPDAPDGPRNAINYCLPCAKGLRRRTPRPGDASQDVPRGY